MSMLDVLTIVHNFADIQTASRIRRTCRRLGVLTPQPIQYSKRRSDIAYEYRVGSKLHRLDGPAEVYITGYKCWYRGGIEHREYRPQSSDEDYRKYMVEGVYHREDGPAITYTICKMWYWRGVPHRKTGPAYDPLMGGVWHTLGKLHRLDGPAYGSIYAIRGDEHRISGPIYNWWIVDNVIIRY